MSNIVKASQAAIEYTPEQIELVKRQIAPNATPDELKLFLYQCQRTGLDALSRQIYCIHRGGKMTIQTSIDGFRVIAERSGTYAGQDEPVFEEGANGTPTKCTVKVYRFGPDNQRYCAGVGVAYWSEYAQQSPLWTKMKHTMLSKCAEALALRKAFPLDLSGLYTSEEMQQADTPAQETIQEAVVVEPTPVPVPTWEEKQLLVNLVHSSNLSEQKKSETLDWIANKCNNYTAYQTMQHKLEAAQPSIDEIPNPSQTDIKKHVKKVSASEAN